MTFLAQLFAHEGDVTLGLVARAGDTLGEVESAEKGLYDLPAPRCVPQPCGNNKRDFYEFKNVKGISFSQNIPSSLHKIYFPN